MYCMSDETQFTPYIHPFGGQHGGDEVWLDHMWHGRFTIDFFPQFDQFPFKSFNTRVWLRTGLLLQNRPYPKVHLNKIGGRWRPELLWPDRLKIVERNRWWNCPCHLWSSHTSSPPCYPSKGWIYGVNCISSDIQYIKHYFNLFHILISLIVFELNSKIIGYTSVNDPVENLNHYFMTLTQNTR